MEVSPREASTLVALEGLRILRDYLATVQDWVSVRGVAISIPVFGLLVGVREIGSLVLREPESPVVMICPFLVSEIWVQSPVFSLRA